MKSILLGHFLLALGFAMPSAGPCAFGAEAPVQATVADEGETLTEIEIDTDEEVPVPVKKPVKSIPKAESRFIRGKDTEGSKALNRFESDSVIQSQYRLNGRSLEVDPD